MSAVTFEDPHVAECSDPPAVERAPSSKYLVQMLLDGELDAAIVGDKLPDPRLEMLIPDTGEAARAWAEKHGAPINHMVVVRTEISRTRPEMVREVFGMFKERRDAAVRAGDKNAAQLQFGLEANRAALDSIIDIAAHQNLIPRKWRVEELFGDVTRSLT
jgi:4,5-dihydroxyphthalate decarboxylase